VIKARRMRLAGHLARMKKEELLALVKAGINFSSFEHGVILIN